MASPSVSDTLGEWFEVYATTDVDLNGLSVANATSRTTVSSANCLRLAANSFGILARNSNAFVNGGLPPPVATYGTVSLSGANETLRLFRGDAGVDELSFFASTNAKAWQVPGELLTDPALITPVINDSPSGLCVAPNRFQTDGGLGDFGSPTLSNPLCDGGAP
jgi:hypothetical protein